MRIMRSNKKMCVLILTHGRPGNVITYDTLIRQGCKKDIIIVIDNEDKKQNEYKKAFKNVYVFDKIKKSKEFDEADNFDDRRAIVYARNAAFDIAKELGYEYFIELDDDYTSFSWRFIDDNGEFKGKTIKNIDKVFDIMCDFIEESGADTIAMAQGGDFIGGAENNNAKCITLKRKAMNSFIFKANSDLRFFGRINEDVNMYTLEGSRGRKIFTINMLQLNQKMTQQNAGGMTDIYKANGTYVKSFYSILHQPSSVKISMMGSKDMRIHHNVNWDKTVPMILREDIK